MTKENHAAGVKLAMLSYLTRRPCPICGVPSWDGNIHAYRGKYGATKKETIWCNGKVRGGIYPKGEGEKDEQIKFC